VKWGGRGMEALEGRVAPLELAEVSAAREYILAVRDQLHFLNGRKNDKLHLDHQPIIAGRLGYLGNRGVLPVEEFLGDLQAAMAEIKVCCREFWLEHAQETGSGDQCRETPQAVAATPEVFLRLLVQAAVEGRSISRAERLLAREMRSAVRQRLAGTPVVLEFFKDLFATGISYRILLAILETGLLESVLPEFESIRDRVQFDGFHTYPVGRHTIEAVRQLEKMNSRNNGLAFKLWSGQEDKLPIYLAILFHVVGKARDIASHPEHGAVLAREVLLSWGAPMELVEEVCFLVARHLLLIQTALQRDLTDESIIFDVAAVCGRTSRLDALYLLTFADARATGTRAWSNWTAQLLRELYGKTRRVLEQKTLAAPQSAQKILDTRERVRSLARDKFQPDYVEKALEQMPARYILRQKPAAIVAHLELLQGLARLIEEERPRLSAGREPMGLTNLVARKRRGSVWDLIFGYMHRPGLFASIAGVLALHEVNIVSADKHVWRDGRSIAVFKVLDPPDPLYAEETWSKVRIAVRSAATGKLSLDYRLAERRRSLLAERRPPSMESQVTVDNESSDFYTIIEVRSWDRVGLLYEITHTFFNLHLSVSTAKIATPGARVLDVFYVRDALGQKIIDLQQVEEIRRALLHRLDS